MRCAHTQWICNAHVCTHTKMIFMVCLRDSKNNLLALVSNGGLFRSIGTHMQRSLITTKKNANRLNKKLNSKHKQTATTHTHTKSKYKQSSLKRIVFIWFKLNKKKRTERDMEMRAAVWERSLCYMDEQPSIGNYTFRHELTHFVYHFNFVGSGFFSLLLIQKHLKLHFVCSFFFTIWSVCFGVRYLRTHKFISFVTLIHRCFIL